MGSIPYYHQEENYKLKQSGSDDKYCILKFSSCDDKYPLCSLSKNDLKSFIKFAKQVENMTWQTIKTYTGLKYEPLPELKKPNNVPDDVTLYSMRMSQKARIIGYRQQDFFYIVWFDSNHETC